MDEELKEKLAPCRHKRHPHLRGFHEESEWANHLDWSRNENDFHQLFQSLWERLDSHYRDEYGVRIDQLFTREDLYTQARKQADEFRQADRLCDTIGIYPLLHGALDEFLALKAAETLKARRRLAIELSWDQTKDQRVAQTD